MRIFGTRTGIKVATLLTALGAAAALSGTAAAEDKPTTQQLLEQCAHADLCEFHPSGNSVHNGSWLLAGSSTNCTRFTQKRTIAYQASEGGTNSFGYSITAGSKLGQSFEASVTASYHREWNWNDTTTNSVEQEVGPHARVIIKVAKQKSRVSGQYELHFSKRYYGHYIWYVPGWIDGQMKGQPWDIKSEQVKADC